METTFTTERIEELRGQPVLDTSGEKIGKVDEVFVDQDTGQPEWIGLGTGMFGSKRVLVPVKGAETRGDGVYVPYSKDQVKDTPDIDGDEISQETERELYSHYGLEYSHAPSATGLPEGEPGYPGGEGPARGGAGFEETTGTGGRDTVTRSEEELAVGKQEVGAGRARLRKWVETEPVETDVELKRETARVTREPVNEPVSDAELGEHEVEVELSEERPVVEKQTVAKERIGLEKDVDVERQTVSDEVRKERVDVEGDDVSR